jgi:DNA-directed RNA polymerase specialized sigma24 family protein
MTDDTSIGGLAERFPLTSWSAVAGARSSDSAERTRSFDTLVAAYWKPVYKTIRVKWRKSNEDAKDLTQGFFLRAMEKDFFAPFDPAKARFRTFLRTCLDGYLANEAKAAGRLKRGGGATMLSLEFETAEGELARTEIPSPNTIERYFDDEWVRSLFGLAVDALRAECAARGRDVHFRIFESYDLDPAADGRPTYDQLAAEHGIPVTSVTNYLALARREFRRIVLERLRELTSTDDEFREEVALLLGPAAGARERAAEASALPDEGKRRVAKERGGSA